MTVVGIGANFEYPAFGYVLASWFVFGFANLWSALLRMVYVAEAERGLGLSPLTGLRGGQRPSTRVTRARTGGT